MKKHLTLKIDVDEMVNQHAIQTRSVSLCMGIVDPEGTLTIPEQVRGEAQ